MSDKPDFSDFEHRVGEVLLVLSDIAGGVYDTRCATDLPVTHPLGALFLGVNELIDVLQAESARRASYQRELEDKLATIEGQSETIRQLSTPIVQVWDGVLCVTILGAFDPSRSARVVEDLLTAVAAQKARHVILDVTGIELLDATTINLFVQLIGAVRLLGARCVLSGVSPALASAMVDSDADLGAIRSYKTLRDALRPIIRGTG